VTSPATLRCRRPTQFAAEHGQLTGYFCIVAQAHITEHRRQSAALPLRHILQDDVGRERLVDFAANLPFHVDRAIEAGHVGSFLVRADATSRRTG
jgi:hypothetical protein